MDWTLSVKDIFGFILPFLEQVPLVRAVLGFVLVFFLPGFAWTLVFFKRIKVLERIALSFALSIAIVTLSIVFSNWILNFKITGTSSALIILALIIIPLGIYYFGKLFGGKEEVEEEEEALEAEDDE